MYAIAASGVNKTQKNVIIEFKNKGRRNRFGVFFCLTFVKFIYRFTRREIWSVWWKLNEMNVFGLEDSEYLIMSVFGDDVKWKVFDLFGFNLSMSFLWNCWWFWIKYRFFCGFYGLVLHLPWFNTILDKEMFLLHFFSRLKMRARAVCVPVEWLICSPGV